MNKTKYLVSFILVAGWREPTNKQADQYKQTDEVVINVREKNVQGKADGSTSGACEGLLFYIERSGNPHPGLPHWVGPSHDSRGCLSAHGWYTFMSL